MMDDFVIPDESAPPTMCGVCETLWALVWGLPNSRQVTTKLK
jgi:hypothetical protein